METTKKPLAASNIPKPSRLPVRSGVGIKRTVREAGISSLEEEQVAPPAKRVARGGGPAAASSSSGGTKPKTAPKCPPAKKILATRKPVAVPKAKTQTLGQNSKKNVAGKSSVASKLKQSGSGRMDQDVLDKLEILSSRMSKLEAEKLESQQINEKLQVQQERGMAEKMQNMQEQLSETRRLLTESEHNLELAQRSKASLQRAFDAVEADLTGARQEISGLKLTVSQMVADATVAHTELEAVKLTRDKAMQESQCKSERVAELKREVEELQNSLLQCQHEIRENESTRRKLHNVIQELKGNIRVFCRMRPLLPYEINASALDDSTASTETTSSSCSEWSQSVVKGDKGNCVVEFPDKEKDSKKISIHFSPNKDGPSSKRSSRSQQYEFEYDHVFGPDCGQEAVFNEISQLVQSALDGYNVCIFAYGQTGSGKTYTMEGPVNADECTQGMIPRALQQVFASSRELNDKGWVYKMEASFIEIYNETLRDLLAVGKKDLKHEIRIDPKNQGEVYVTNINPTLITSEQQVTQLLDTAAKHRAVAATESNERSSRSHCVFRLTLSGTNSKTMETCHGTLNLVDLAGSERLANSGNASERLKETQSINKSLSNLGNVIMALANREQHIPYRNSKLTYLLQNSLGGNSKTLMFVNISPQPSALQETLSSLRFASKVNQCHIGTARKTTKQ